MSATRQRYRCHRFGTLLRWGIRIRCFDYSRVTRVLVLLTFYPTSLRYLRILASLRVTQCDSLLLAYPHVLLTCGPFIEFVGFFPVSQGYSCVGVGRHDDYSADSSTSLAQCSFVGGFSSEFRDFRANFGSSWEIRLFFLTFYWQFQCLSLPTQPAYSPLSLSSSDAVYELCQSAYSGCSYLVRDLALGVSAAAHLLWWLLFCLL